MINYKYIDILNNKDKKTSILKIKINKYNKILNSLSDLIALFGLLIKKIYLYSINYFILKIKI